MEGKGPFSDQNKKTAACAAIKAEILSYEATIHAFQEKVRECKTRHNNLADIHKLPDELFIEIFMHLVLRETKRMTLRWIRVTHVCTRWRQVALDCPRLWTWPPFRRSMPVDILLQRSRSAPLNILLNLNGPSGQDEVQVAMKNMHRAQTLTIHEFETHAWRYYSKLAPNATLDFPLLKSIELQATYAQQRRLSIDRMRINVPQLSHLILKNIGLPKVPVALLCPLRLTSLDMEILKGNHERRQQNSLREILDFLGHCRLLRRLQLSNVFSADPDSDEPEDSTQPTPRIELQAVAEIDIHSTAGICCRFFEAVTYPTHGVSISIRCTSSPVEDVRRLFRSTVNHLKDTVRALHILPVDMSKRPGLHKPHSFSFWTPTSACDDDLKYSDRQATICITAPFESEILRNWCQMLPMENLEHLIYHAPTSEEGIWEDFGSLGNLRLLDIGNTHQSFLKTLLAPWWADFCLNSSYESQEGQTAVNDAFKPEIVRIPSFINIGKPRYFTALRDLTFNRWVFKGLPLPPGFHLGTLAKSLVKRRECGYGLSNLHIWQCQGISCDDVEEFLGAAEQAYWDE